MTIYTGGAPSLNRRSILDVPAEGAFGELFTSALQDNPTTSLVRLENIAEQEQGRAVVMGPESYLAENAGRLEPETPVVSQQEARDRVDSLGLKLDIPAQGIRQGALDILITRKQEELARQQVVERAGAGLGVKIAAGVAASLTDPLNIASAFVPVVGPARYARLLESATTPLGRAAVRAGVGATEGVVGAAILEPLPLLAAQADQSEYGLSDSLANIAFGGLLGGGLHSVGGAVSDRLRRNLATPEAARVETAATNLAEPAKPVSLASFDRAFDDSPVTALEGALAKQLQDDAQTLRAAAQQRAVDSVRATLATDTLRNVADLKAQRLGLTSRLDGLDATYRDRAKAFQAQGMTRKQAERATRDAIAVERDNIGEQLSQVDSMLERNRAGELSRADAAELDRGRVPERLREVVEARTQQIMEGYQRRPLGVAIRTAREQAEQADWQVRQSAFNTAVTQAVTGREIEVQSTFDLEDPAKSRLAMDSIRKGPRPRQDPAAQIESKRVTDLVESQGDESKRAADELAAEEQMVREMMNQLPEADRLAVEKYSKAEMDLSADQTAKAEQYSKAYRAAALCDIRSRV